MRVVTQGLAGATQSRDVVAAKAVGEAWQEMCVPQAPACEAPLAAASASHAAVASRNGSCRLGLGAAKSPVGMQLLGMEALGCQSDAP